MQFNEREKFATLRRRKRLSMAEIAREIGCTRQMLSLFELGDSGMRPELIEKYKNCILKHSE